MIKSGLDLAIRVAAMKHIFIKVFGFPPSDEFSKFVFYLQKILSTKSKIECDYAMMVG